MNLHFIGFLAVVLLLTVLQANAVKSSTKTFVPVGSETIVSAAAPSAVKDEQTAVFAGGCFWGVEAVFEHVKGVTDVISGYSGGIAQTAQYEIISAGKTGHAEVVKIILDPSRVSYEQLLKVFFSLPITRPN